MRRTGLGTNRQKVVEQAGTDGRGALGVELSAVEIAPLHAGAEGRAVAGARDGGGAQIERVAMHEIRVIAIGQSLEQRARTPYLEGIPAHMRHRPITSLGEARRAAGN